MDISHYHDLLSILKPLADEHRLRVITMMSEREWSVGALAQTLGLAESTTSYHISKLHGAGLLRLRMDGSHRFYSLNSQRIDKLKAYINEIDTPIVEPEPVVSDNRWIDALDFSADEKKVLRDYTFNGKLTQIPTKDKKWLVILRWLTNLFEPNTRYTEKQVNAILTEVYDDYATMRRDLVEYGFMRRERGGGDYWLTPEDEPAAP
jgi:hypothetical protein